jgi:hypothetical protein
MDCRIEWSNSRVEQGELSVGLEPAPDFAFMKEFDRLVNPIGHPGHKGWGRVLIAHGDVVVTDVHLESGEELRAFLEETVREANRLAVDTRIRDQERAQARAAGEAQKEAQQAATEQAAADHDAHLTAVFRRSG